MSFYFKPFPKVDYKVGNNDVNLTNIMLRFKIKESLKAKSAIYFEYDIKDSDRPDTLAYRYYDDETLDWLIFVINDIVDPHYDWPLGYVDFNNYIKNKYGSIESAKTTIHEYRRILQEQTVSIDGTVIPKRIIVIDKTTFDSLPSSETETVYQYDYEDELNENKRHILLLDERYLSDVLSVVRNAFA